MDCAPARRPVVGRFAPTPSGKIHLGNVFSALMAWASVRSAGGKMILRIEDLDPRAQNQRVADDLMRDYEWLGLSWDEGPYYQSRRTDAYQEALETLGDRGLTYPCFCSRAELHATSAPHAAARRMTRREFSSASLYARHTPLPAATSAASHAKCAALNIPNPPAAPFFIVKSKSLAI